MTTRSRSYLAVFAVALLATPSAAQDWLIVDGVSVRASGNVGEPTGPAPRELFEYAAEQDRRLLAGGGRFAFDSESVVDLRTGARVFIREGQVLAVDPVRPRAFLEGRCDWGTLQCVVASWDFGSGAIQPLTPAPLIPGARYAVDADLLFVTQRSTVAAQVIQAVNATTGVPAGPPLSVPIGTWDVSPDGSRVFVTRGPLGFGVADGIDVFDARSGAIVGSTVAKVSHLLGWSSALGALVAQTEGGVTAYLSDLTPVGTIPDAGDRCAARVEVSAHTGRMYALLGGGSLGGFDDTPVPHRFLVFSPQTGQWTDVDIDRVLPQVRGHCVAMRLLTAPGPPRDLHATVSGHDVWLAWENVGAASGFVLDVGFAPGRTDLQVYLGPDSHTAFANVPSGTYYLRLRGGNEFGGGRPSREVRVVVP